MLSRMTSAPPASRRIVDEVLLVVVDRPFGAESLAELPLLGGSRGGEDAGAEGVGGLDREGADAAGAAVDQEGVAGLKVRDHEDVRPDRAGHLRQRRRRPQGDP